MGSYINLNAIQIDKLYHTLLEQELDRGWPYPDARDAAFDQLFELVGCDNYCRYLQSFAYFRMRLVNGRDDNRNSRKSDRSGKAREYLSI